MQTSIALVISVILFASAILPATQSTYAVTWAQSIGQSSTNENVFRGIAQGCNDDGYLLAGSVEENRLSDFLLVRLNEDGSARWSATLGGANDDDPRDLVVRCDTVVRQEEQVVVIDNVTVTTITNVTSTAESFVIVGATKTSSFGANDIFAVRINGTDGAVIWNKVIGKGGADYAHSVSVTDDDDYIVGGYETFQKQKDFFVAKLDGDTGDLLWHKSLRSIGMENHDVVRDVEVLTNGNIVATGYAHSQGENGNIMVITLSPDGDLIWAKHYGGARFEESCCIIELDDGFVIAEESSSFSSGIGAWIFKLDYDGNVEWQTLLDGKSQDEISDAILGENGVIYFTGEHRANGSTKEDFWFVTVNSTDGKMITQMRQGTAGQDEAEAITLSPDGGAVMAGFTRDSSGNTDIWLVKVNSEGYVDECDIQGSMTNANIPSLAVQKTTNTNDEQAQGVELVTNASVNSKSLTNDKLLLTPINVNIQYECEP